MTKFVFKMTPQNSMAICDLERINTVISANIVNKL